MYLHLSESEWVAVQCQGPLQCKTQVVVDVEVRELPLCDQLHTRGIQREVVRLVDRNGAVQPVCSRLDGVPATMPLNL